MSGGRRSSHHEQARQRQDRGGVEVKEGPTWSSRRWVEGVSRK